MSLPIFQTDDKDLQLLQTGWAQQLNPVIQNPIAQSLLLQNVVLKNGTNIINHTLGRQMRGYIIADQNAAASFYRSKPFNNLTLSLVASAPVTVSLVVF